MTNQQSAIIGYLEENGTITPMQAFRSLGITKLATRIGELTREGYVFQKELIKVRTRNGDTHVMRYSLVDWEAVVGERRETEKRKKEAKKEKR